MTSALDEGQIARRLVALEAVVRTQSTFASLERSLVIAARNDGCSWREIASALGVSRQAAHRRFRAIDPRPPRETDDLYAEALELARRFAEADEPLLTGPGPISVG